MTSLSSREQELLQVARSRGVLRSRDLEAGHFPRSYLRRLSQRGLLIPLGRGAYLPAQAQTGEFQTFIEVARRVPGGVICLLSALRFHELTTQEPGKVWLAIESRARPPQLPYPRLEIVRMSGKAWSEGVEEHELPIYFPRDNPPGDDVPHSDVEEMEAVHVPVRFTSPAKTVVDCFRFRSRVGLDVALEALRDGLRSKKVSASDLHRHALEGRVWSVLRPYMEALLAS